jgi:hypothetical protein
VDAAKDMNKVLELSPSIDVKKGVKELRAEVVEAATLLKDKDGGYFTVDFHDVGQIKDPISTETRASLRALIGTDADAEEDDKVAETGDAASDADAPPAASVKKVDKAKEKTKGEPRAVAPASASNSKSSKTPREKPGLGEFKPIRHGSRIHTFVVMAQEGKTLDEMAKKSGNAKYVAKDIRWWMCQYLRRHHGIRGVVDDGGKVKLEFPAGKKLEDCVTEKVTA